MSWLLFAHISLIQLAHAPQFFYYLKKYLNEPNNKGKSGGLLMWLVVLHSWVQVHVPTCVVT
jgi:hypothetical protein